MRLVSDLRSGLLAASTWAVLQFVGAAHGQYAAYPGGGYTTAGASYPPAPLYSPPPAVGTIGPPQGYANPIYTASLPRTDVGSAMASQTQPSRYAAAPAASTLTIAAGATTAVNSAYAGLGFQPTGPARVALDQPALGTAEATAPGLGTSAGGQPSVSAEEYIVPEPLGANGALENLGPSEQPLAAGEEVQESPPSRGVDAVDVPAYASGDVESARGLYSTYGCDEPGAIGRLVGEAGCNYWFGGVYGLVMDRDRSADVPLAFVATGLNPGDYTPSNTAVLSSRDVDTDFQGGVEVRFGRTFGGRFGGGALYSPQWGLEAAYWEIFDNQQYDQYVDEGTMRTYSMLPMNGLEFDAGSGAAPVNEYWDYAPPVGAGNVVVTMARARSHFDAQNVEINLLRFALCGQACAAPAVCDVGCDAAGCGYGSSGGASRFSCTGVCGVRYLQLDDSFMYGVNFFNTATTASGYLDYWSRAENSLVGAQFGCNNTYRVGRKWGLHLNTLVGLFGNDVDVRRYFYSSGGTVTYAATGEPFDVAASKTDFSMLGELRLGASYQANQHVRVYGGWRAIGVSGVALSTEQTPPIFLDAAQMAGYVNSNSSMILHGLQTGLEWNY